MPKIWAGSQVILIQMFQGTNSRNMALSSVIISIMKS